MLKMWVLTLLLAALAAQPSAGLGPPDYRPHLLLSPECLFQLYDTYRIRFAFIPHHAYHQGIILQKMLEQIDFTQCQNVPILITLDVPDPVPYY